MVGRFQLTISAQTIELEAGDSFQFDANVRHRLRNMSAGETRILWIINSEIGA